MSFRVGLIGYGTAGAYFHAPLITSTPGLVLQSIVTSREVPPGVQRLDRPDQLWEDHDLVVIATPNSTHVPLATEAVLAGVAVVVDKPFAPTAEEARALTELAASRNVPLTVFQNRRWDGDFLTVRELIRTGALGRVVRFESHFDRWRPVPKQTWKEDPDPGAAGGVLFDLGPHVIDQALQLFGPMRSVYAEVRKLRDGAQVDDDFFLALTHESGFVSHLAASTLAAHQAPRFRVLGTSNGYVKHGLDGQEAALRAGSYPGVPGWGEEPESAWGRLEDSPYPTKNGCYQYFYNAMVSVLKDGAPVPVSPESAIATLEVIEQAIEETA
jgi:predicted dehydrogenase